MRIDHKRLVLSVALAGAMSVLVAGCGKTANEQASQPANTSQAATTPEPASATQPADTSQAATTPEPASATKSADSSQAATTTVGTEIDDSVITTKVKAALLADPDVKSFDIAVETHKGEVQLSGFVDSQAQIDHAVAVAKKVEGVTNVGNALSIKK